MPWEFKIAFLPKGILLVVMFPVTFLGLLALVATLAQAAKDTTTYPTPGPTYEASDYTKWEARHVGKSKRASVEIKFTADDGSDDYIALTRLDLVGNSYDRGFAHGKLLYKGECDAPFKWEIECWL